MGNRFGRPLAALIACVGCILESGCLSNWGSRPVVLPEQETISIRPPSQLPKARIPDVAEPETVSRPKLDAEQRFISLDEAIHLALANGKVVRVLTGVGAASSSSTIYDAAISNTVIDQEAGRFDPIFSVGNAYNRVSAAAAALDPASPFGARIGGGRSDNHNFSTELSKTGFSGAVASLKFTDDLSRRSPGLFPLNPQNARATTLSLTQPLLRGAGRTANLAPLVIARINTERTYFQFKDSLQESVRGVIDAYWALVFARTDFWARQQQVRQGEAAFERAEARFRGKIGTAAEMAQSRLALANFKASMISAQSNLILREAALRNILGLPPADSDRLIPTTAPLLERRTIHWDEIIRLAEEHRPDLIELKLLIEIDQQRLAQAENQARPQVDVQTFYRWNGLEGVSPSGAVLGTEGGRFSDISLALNVALPLGLRRDRAAFRQQQLTLAKDWANLEQGLHSALHQVANSQRFLSQYFEQYRSLKIAREAAQVNLDQQLAENRSGRAIFLNVLQAITDWGNAVSAEAQSVTQYNTELANLERLTGTILETHSIRFFEERFGSISAKGRRGPMAEYPESMRPTVERGRYGSSSEPSERVFDLRDPTKKRDEDSDKGEPERLPLPKIK
jgi:outer membrane protein TolC